MGRGPQKGEKRLSYRRHQPHSTSKSNGPEACTSASLEPSYVLRALGRKDELAHSSIRFSFGRFTKESDVDKTLSILNNVVDRLRELSPLWEMHLDGIDLDTVTWNTH